MRKSALTVLIATVLVVGATAANAAATCSSQKGYSVEKCKALAAMGFDMMGEPAPGAKYSDFEITSKVGTPPSKAKCKPHLIGTKHTDEHGGHTIQIWGCGPVQ